MRDSRNQVEPIGRFSFRSISCRRCGSKYETRSWLADDDICPLCDDELEQDERSHSHLLISE